MASLCNVYHYCTSSFNKPWTQALLRFKSCSWQWWESLTWVPAENKAQHLFSVSHSVKTIHYHHHTKYKWFIFFHWLFQSILWWQQKIAASHVICTWNPTENYVSNWIYVWQSLNLHQHIRWSYRHLLNINMDNTRR